jgi:hypothetical protein
MQDVTINVLKSQQLRYNQVEADFSKLALPRDGPPISRNALEEI